MKWQKSFILFHVNSHSTVWCVTKSGWKGWRKFSHAENEIESHIKFIRAMVEVCNGNFISSHASEMKLSFSSWVVGVGWKGWKVLVKNNFIKFKKLGFEPLN